MAHKLGHETTISIGSNQLKLSRDITVNQGGSEVDVTSRNSGGVKQVVLGLKDLSINFQAIYDASDSAITALQVSYNAGTPVSVTLSDPTLDYNGSWVCTQFNVNEPIDGVVTVDVTLKPTVGTSS